MNTNTEEIRNEVKNETYGGWLNEKGWLRRHLLEALNEIDCNKQIVEVIP